jgi:hypothetical protein
VGALSVVDVEVRFAPGPGTRVDVIELVDVVDVPLFVRLSPSTI